MESSREVQVVLPLILGDCLVGTLLQIIWFSPCGSQREILHLELKDFGGGCTSLIRRWQEMASNGFLIERNSKNQDFIFYILLHCTNRWIPSSAWSSETNEWIIINFLWNKKILNDFSGMYVFAWMMLCHIWERFKNIWSLSLILRLRSLLIPYSKKTLHLRLPLTPANFSPLSPVYYIKLMRD